MELKDDIVEVAAGEHGALALSTRVMPGYLFMVSYERTSVRDNPEELAGRWFVLCAAEDDKLVGVEHVSVDAVIGGALDGSSLEPSTPDKIRAVAWYALGDVFYRDVVQGDLSHPAFIADMMLNAIHRFPTYGELDEAVVDFWYDERTDE